MITPLYNQIRYQENSPVVTAAPSQRTGIMSYLLEKRNIIKNSSTKLTFSTAQKLYLSCILYNFFGNICLCINFMPFFYQKKSITAIHHAAIRCIYMKINTAIFYKIWRLAQRKILPNSRRMLFRWRSFFATLPHSSICVFPGHILKPEISTLQ